MKMAADPNLLHHNYLVINMKINGTILVTYKQFETNKDWATFQQTISAYFIVPVLTAAMC